MTFLKNRCTKIKYITLSHLSFKRLKLDIEKFEKKKSNIFGKPLFNDHVCLRVMI